MSESFKFIGLRLLEGCSEKILKNLEKGKVYKFYNDYHFLNEKGNEVERPDEKILKITCKESLPEDLYKIKSESGELNINISALVGKNGSGKSSLLEIFYLVCFLLGRKAGLLPIIESVNDKKPLSFYIIEDLETLHNRINVELLYSINDCVYCIHFKQSEIIVKKARLDEEFVEWEFKDVKSIFKELFFYTISVNYSLYGLNERHLGIWIKYLYHKNDSYQVPIVINPFRNEGQIDVNNELHLAQSRLLSNLIDDSFTTNEIISKKTVKSLKFTITITDYVDDQSDPPINEKTPEEQLEEYWQVVFELVKAYGSKDNKGFITDLYYQFYNVESEISISNKAVFDTLAYYSFRKIIKICENYYDSQTKDLISELSNEDSTGNKYNIFKKLIDIVKDDRSHITLKLRQALNSIRFNLLREDKEKGLDLKYEIDLNQFYIEIPIEEFIERIKDSKKIQPSVDLIELIPLGKYSCDIITKSNSDDTDTGEISQLSSGEQHFIHSLQSVFYHISNINSVFKSTGEKLKYKFLNLIFDEIELYYHPEFQRRFIYELLNGLSKMNIPNIKGINIIFCTHSPFILSDIPKECTLKLDNGKIVPHFKKNTFGANIHDLLDDDFFLNNGFMGEFAKTKIESLIDYLEKNENLDFVEKGWNKESSRKFIEIIGEPILKMTLNEMFRERFRDLN